MIIFFSNTLIKENNMLTQEIKNTIQTLWDRLWAGGLSNPITAIEQISYLIFMKRLENFHSNTPFEYKWSEYHNWEDDKLFIHIKNKVFPYIKNELAEKDEAFSIAMEDAIFAIKSVSLLSDSIAFIDKIYEEIEKQENDNNQNFQDIQGDIYEYLLKHTSEAGKNGQFRTPRHIIQLMAEIIKPDLDGKICDLACGSGGFLVGAYHHIITKYSNKIVEDENGLPKGVDAKKLSISNIKELNENIFFGFDIDQTMVRIATMNLLMHGIKKPKINNMDTLSRNYEDFEKNILKSKFKYILANPPFTGKINSLEISENLDNVYPPQFDAQKNRIKQLVQSELLFLERIIFMLDKGGKAAVIVPEGVLFNAAKQYKAIRKLLMTKCNLEAVVSLPSGVFYPYTGVKTSILIFEKKSTNSNVLQKNDVWFYEMESDGYSLDNNRRKLKDLPLQSFLNDWINKDKNISMNREEKYFTVSSEEIKKNDFELNYNLYKEFTYESLPFVLPEDLLKEILLTEAEINLELKELKGIL